MKPVSCPGCIYSGQPHLEGCENSQWLPRILNEASSRSQLNDEIDRLTADEILIVSEYIRRLIQSRPKD